MSQNANHPRNSILLRPSGFGLNGADRVDDIKNTDVYLPLNGVVCSNGFLSMQRRVVGQHKHIGAKRGYVDRSSD